MSLWRAFRTALLEALDHEDGLLRERAGRELTSFGERIGRDEVLRKRLDSWGSDFAVWAVGRYGDELTTVITTTIERWDGQEAARKMLDADTGSLPVDDGQRIVGIITDRDIAVRAIADGRGPETLVREVMSERLLFAWEDQDVEEVAARMGDAQVRRLPVLSRLERLVGIVSLGDLARSADDDSAEVVLAGVSAPGATHNQSQE